MILEIGYHTTVRLEEIAFLLLALGGIALASAQIPLFSFAKGRTVAAGLAFAASGVLLIVATHWGHLR